MLNFVRHSIYKILFGKEGETMMAMLWAQKIMYAETKVKKNGKRKCRCTGHHFPKQL